MMAIVARAVAVWLVSLGLMASEAQAAWYEASTDHFILYADDKEAEIRLYAENLERFHSAMEIVTGNILDASSPSGRVQVYVVGSLKQVEKLAGQRGIAGFYLARAGNSAAFVQTIRNQEGSPHFSTVVMQHEYAHHFLFSTTRFPMPLWMSEGAAEFFGATGYRADGSVAVGLHASHRWRDLYFAKNTKIAVTPLLDYDPDKPFGTMDRDSFYSRAWLLYHFLSTKPEREGQLRAYWLNVLRGTPSIDAAQNAFGSVSQLERELASYYRSRQGKHIEVPADKIEVGDVTLRALSEGEAAMMPVRIRSPRQGREQAGAGSPRHREEAQRRCAGAECTRKSRVRRRECRCSHCCCRTRRKNRPEPARSACAQRKSAFPQDFQIASARWSGSGL